jgi:hypothetical protein
VIHVILETKGFDPLEEVKRAAAERWVAAVNADGNCGKGGARRGSWPIGSISANLLRFARELLTAGDPSTTFADNSRTPRGFVCHFAR